MTNAQIIMNNRVFLMQEGIIKAAGTGEMVEVETEEGIIEIEMPEEIHTFNEWKRAGFMVQKGQHAVAKFQIWMPKKNKKAKAEDAEDQERDDEEAKMAAKGFYKKVAAFFTADQVKPIEK